MPERVNLYLPRGLKDRVRRELGPGYSISGALRGALLADLERKRSGELVVQDEIPEGLPVSAA